MVDKSNTEKLMNAIINKMESMDHSIDDLKNENNQLKKMINNPGNILKRAGFLSAETPLTTGLTVDNFRADLGLGEATLLKNAESRLDDLSNEDVHQMSWDDIHKMADMTKNVEELI